MTYSLFGPMLMLLISFLFAPQETAPQFKDYPVTPVKVKQNAPLVLTAKDREFRSRLREAAKEKPNFAGHYIVAEWGCGAGCVMGAVIDAQTGKVIWLPHTTCCWPVDVEEPVQYKLDSSLIVFYGMRNEKEGDEGTHFYNFKNGRFVHIKSVPKAP